jgi:pimeloyl-ACP methyl ester carboxylesterase
MVRRLLGVLGTFLGAILLASLLHALIPGWTPAIEGPNPISELATVELGGADQWLLVRGRDASNPVLLFLHGGPGGAFISQARRFSDRLEEHFVVVHWDQRGAGKSCSADQSEARIDLEQYLADTHELVELLRRRFGNKKIYLLGHSWGSVLGVITVQRHPELFHAYVGLGQIVDKRRNEEVSYRWVLGRAEAERNEEALAELRSIEPPYANLGELLLQRSWLAHYGGDYVGGGANQTIGRGMLSAPEYTLLDKLRALPCMDRATRHVYDQWQDTDFFQNARRFEVPIYLFTGRHDYNTPFELVEEWFPLIQAPHKEIVWFEHSAHFACLEEPERFQDALIRRVLRNAIAR